MQSSLGAFCRCWSQTCCGGAELTRVKALYWFFSAKTIKCLWLFQGISVFHNSGRNIMAAQAENSACNSNRSCWHSSENF